MKRDRSRHDHKYQGEDESNGCHDGEVSICDAEGNGSRLSETSTSSLLTDRISSYSTFTPPKDFRQPSCVTQRPTLCRMVGFIFYKLGRQRAGKGDPKIIEWVIEQNHHLTTRTWRGIIFLSVAIAMIAYLHDKAVDSTYMNFMPAEWHWDHNIYITKDSTEVAIRRDVAVSLIAQIVPGRALGHLEDISSRPNRAYARQWGLDFARYDTGHSSYNPRACFEKVVVLNAILDRQSNYTGDLISLWSHNPRVEYEFILLLPPDSILTELDTDVIKTILPNDKLVAIGGWNRHHKLVSNSDVIVFNLKHRYATAVARLWFEMVLPRQVTCGASNDLGMLVDAIASVMEESEDMDDLIEPLPESEDGFLGNGVIKIIPPSVPGARTALLSKSIVESAAILQETADSVCYRFYPKCEVLTEM